MAETDPDLHSGTDSLAEIDALLEIDGRKIGAFWRAQKEDEDAGVIAEKMGWATPSAVWSYRKYIDVLRGTSPAPTAPAVALQCSRQIASFIRRHPDLSGPTKNLLEDRKRDCDAKGDEYEEHVSPSSDADSDSVEDQAGVYVYTLPHYLNHPVHPATETHGAISKTPRTFLKVGKSDVDINVRIRQQASTALPERPLKLRLYRNDESAIDLERKIHRMLKAADHNPNEERGAGKEWFMTNLKFLDAIAVAFEIQIERYNEDKTAELET